MHIDVVKTRVACARLGISHFALELRRGLLLGLVAAMLSMAAATAWGQTPSAPSLIVKLMSGLTAGEQAAVITRNGGIEVSSVAALRLHVVQVTAAEQDAVLAKYKADPQVVRAEVNKTRQSDAVPSDPLYGQQWSLTKIG